MNPPREYSFHSIVVGAGAAGFFAAIAAAEQLPRASVALFEAGPRPLSKVKISGGGRCNVTHHCFDPKALCENYPRGQKELRGPFARFQPQDTVRWFESRGVPLKTEPDNRMFPKSNNSQSIIDCLDHERLKYGVELFLKFPLESVSVLPEGGFCLRFRGVIEDKTCQSLLLATGSSPKGLEIARSLGHEIIPPVPSLFTFCVEDKSLQELSGIAMPKSALELQTKRKTFQNTGPLLITHWGLSGPAVLKLSAWAARELAECDYSATLYVNWLGESTDLVRKKISVFAQERGSATVRQAPFSLPERLWFRFLTKAGLPREKRWAETSRAEQSYLAELLTREDQTLSGKGEFKEEFVTCGGVSLKEINFQRMESKKHRGLFFAGEILDIDGVTGGFNFQSAWTTGYIAGMNLCSSDAPAGDISAD